MTPDQKAYEWIKRNIELSTNPFQFEGCEKLIDLFELRYSNHETGKWLRNHLSEKMSVKVCMGEGAESAEELN